MNTYWVEYDFVGEQWNNITRNWEVITDTDACRFQCLKKDIKKEVANKILDDYGSMRFLRLTIHDCYLTTDTEV